MGTAKEQALDIIRSLPDDATLDEIMAELYFKLQVDLGLKELDEGRGIPHEQAAERMSRWLVR